MRVGFRCLVLCWTSALACGTAEAAPFEPKVSDVCSPSPRNARVLALDHRKLVGQLLKHAGISPIDLDTSGNSVSYQQQVAALLNPSQFCSAGTCADKIPRKLQIAFINLDQFLRRHAEPADLERNPIDTRNLAEVPSLGPFLRGDADPEVAVCLAKPKDPAGPDSAKPKPDEPQIPRFFSLRQNIEDLPIPQSSPKFKGLKQASMSVTNDWVASKSSFAVDLAAGYTFGRAAFDEDGRFIGQITPFFTYNQNFVQTPDPAKSVRAQNVGVGVLGDLTFPIGIFDGYQNIQFYPKYVVSLRSDAEVLSGNFVYSPLHDVLSIPGIGSVFYLIPEALSFKLVPQVKAVIHDVIDPGTDTALLKKGSYYWIGPRFDLTFFGEGMFEGFKYNVSYETYKVFEGTIKNVSFFQTALSYDLDPKKLASIQLKYQKGRNLDTLEQVDQVTLGLGVKY